MKKVLITILLSLGIIPCFAQNEITLYCKTSDGISIPSPLIIDLVRDNAKWGFLGPYEIFYKTDEWITLFAKDLSKKIGGELMVINRLNGEYKRVAISDFCTDETCKSSRVSNGYYFGTCYQQKF